MSDDEPTYQPFDGEVLQKAISAAIVNELESAYFRKWIVGKVMKGAKGGANPLLVDDRVGETVRRCVAFWFKHHG
jgi:Asp-tRNA(Asn)/Glu-tRNA(Gln) amidotransferase B subunit